MNGSILTCKVAHDRHSPARHTFSYPIYSYLFDVDRLDELGASLRLFGYNRVRLASIHDRDYLEQGEGSIRRKLTRLLDNTAMALDGRDTILLATSAKFLNYVFNPVSFYWVYRDSGLLGCVAEVNNTFGEKHVYPLPGQGETGAFPAQFHADKAFHVSPFYDRSGVYAFSFSDVREHLAVSVTLNRDGETAFEASLEETAPRRPMTDGELLRLAFTRPFTAHLTMPRILAQAARIHYGKKIAYNPKPSPMNHMTIRTATRLTATQSLARTLIHAKLRTMTRGTLTLSGPGNMRQDFGSQPGASARIEIRDADFFPRVLLNGDIGLGEGYSEGLWDSPDLGQVFRFFLDNQSIGRASFPQRMLHRLGGLIQRFRHQAAPPNTQDGTKKNIAAHYDLSNSLFQSFLDPTMTYSSAVFEDLCEDADLEQAQRRKNRLLADKARITADDHVLEVGCGWGGFAVQTARERGCRVTGVTVSEQQYAYARERVRRAGLEHLVDIRLQDYRRLTETFDKIVSIEMIEAVGHSFHAQFFKSLDRLLAPCGLIAMQAITIQDGHYDHYRQGMDWIRKHIFPGGALPSLARICEVTARETSLLVQRVESLGMHYARTLRLWRERFLDQWPSIEQLGFDTTFKRTWEYYLTICEAGFLSGHINNAQIVLTRAEHEACQQACLHPGGPEPGA